MKTLLTTIFIFSFAVSTIFSQENVLHSEILQAKKLNIHFENIALKEVKSGAEILEKFTNPDEVFFFENSFIEDRSKEVKAMNLSIPAKDKILVLELIEVTDSFYSYEVITSDGKKFPANRDIKHYRGVVQGDVNSLVSISFYEDEIMGLICTGEGNYNIVKDIQSNTHVLFNEKNLKQKLDFECGTIDDDHSFSYETEMLLRQRNSFNEQQTSLQTTLIDKKVGFYFETEYDIYQTRGSVSSVEAFISGLFNQVAILYQNEDIQTSIASLYIWIADDPYTGTSTSSLLYQFKNIRTSFIGDLAMLLTFRSSVGGGEAAGFNGLCNPSNRQKMAVSMLYNSNNDFPTYSWSVYVVTHEYGHLFGSRHTHGCVWNGDNTAIDGCAGYVEGSCSLPGYPSGGGTIMSYCHLSGRPGINFNLGFGPQPGNVIRNSVINASCLQPCNTPVNVIDQTITGAALTVNSCGDINVQTVTVSNGAKLTLDAAGEVNIISDFEVELGSELEIK
jgi:hypothetical protein